MCRPTLRGVMAFSLSLTLCALVVRAEAGEPKVRVDAHGDPLPAGAITRIGTARLCNGGQVAGLAFSPDGRWIASEDGNGVVHLWDAATGKEIRAMKPPVAGWGPLTFSSDGKVLASSAGGKLVCLWDPHTGRLLRDMMGPERMVRSVALSTDAKLVAAGAGDGVIFVWEAATGNELHKLKGHRDGPNGLAFAPDGKTLVSTGHDGTTRVWDLKNGQEIGKIAPNPFSSSAVRLIATGKTIVTAGGQDGLIRYWDAATRQLVRQFPAHKGGVLCLATSADGKILASGGYDRVVRFWNAETTAELGQIPEQSGSVNHLALSPDGSTVAWNTLYGARIYLGRTGLPKKFAFAEVLPRGGHEAGILSLAYSADGKKILSASSNNQVILWDELSGKELHRFGAGYCAALSASGKLVAVADVNDGSGTIRFYDAVSGKEARLHKHPAQVYSLAFSPTGRSLICGGSNGTVHVIELATGKPRLRLEGNTHLRKVLLAPDGHTLAVVASEEVLLWDLISGKQLGRVPAQLSNHAIAFSSDGKLLACGIYKDSAIMVWDVAAGKEVRRIRHRVQDLVFSADCRTLTGVCADHAIRLWDVASGKELHQFSGHGAWTYALALSPDGGTLISGGQDTTLLLWAMDGFARGKPVPPSRLSAKELLARCRAFPPGEWPEWWKALALPDAEPAHRAVWGLVSEPKESVPVISKWVAEFASAQVEKLIMDLDSDDFARREGASKKLERLGRLAEPALLRALNDKLALEPRRRIERILAVRGAGSSAADEGLRFLRVIEVLEHIGSAEARGILAALAKQAPTADIAAEAKASLERLVSP